MLEAEDIDRNDRAHSPSPCIGARGWVWDTQREKEDKIWVRVTGGGWCYSLRGRAGLQREEK